MGDWEVENSANSKDLEISSRYVLNEKREIYCSELTHYDSEWIFLKSTVQFDFELKSMDFIF